MKYNKIKEKQTYWNRTKQTNRREKAQEKARKSESHTFSHSEIS